MSDELKLYSIPDPVNNPPPPSTNDVQQIVGDNLRNLNEPVQLQQNQMQSANFVSGSAGWQLRPDGAEINGALAVSKIDIPDITTANSAHIDSSGNQWWGANVATGLSGANASITSAGLAKFKNILIGGATIQYQVSNSGIFSFGDGSDGAGVADGSTAVAGASLAGSTYTLTRDVYYTDLTVSTGVDIVTAGYRIFGTGTCTLNGTGKIHRDGNAGTVGENGRTNGTHALGGSAGAALADGYLKGALAGHGGGQGGTNGISSVGGIGSVGADGVATTNSLGSNSVASGTGGDGGAGISGGGSGAASGATATATASNVKLIANWHLATLLDISSSGSTVKFDNSASAPGGGGAGGGGSINGTAGGGGAGGGSGSPGGIVAIYFRVIVIGASASITANGGNGGKGGDGANAVSGGPSSSAGAGGGGGGGASGNGGIIILCYNTLTNSGSIAAAAGTPGAKGVHGTPIGSGGNGTDGSAGTAGAAGVVYQFQISL